MNIHLPSSWNELPTRDLERVMQLGIERDIMSGHLGHLAERQFKVKACLTMMGLRLKGKVRFLDNKEYFVFRKRSWWPWSKKVYLAVNDIHYSIDKRLQWLDSAFTRTRAPYDIIRSLGKRFKGPTTRMTSVTYQQYTMAQALLTTYWTIQDNIKWLLENRPESKKSIRLQMRNLQKTRCRFIACLFCPSAIETEISREGRKRRVRHRTWEFDPIQIENWWRFWFSSAKLFPVVLQFFLSVQQYFASVFPDLFVPADKTKDKRPDYLLQEIETMTAIMKYQGFSDYQTIYDSNTVHILKVLDNMVKESKELKRISAKK